MPRVRQVSLALYVAETPSTRLRVRRCVLSFILFIFYQRRIIAVRSRERPVRGLCLRPREPDDAGHRGGHVHRALAETKDFFPLLFDPVLSDFCQKNNAMFPTWRPRNTRGSVYSCRAHKKHHRETIFRGRDETRDLFYALPRETRGDNPSRLYSPSFSATRARDETRSIDRSCSA